MFMYGFFILPHPFLFCLLVERTLVKYRLGIKDTEGKSRSGSKEPRMTTTTEVSEAFLGSSGANARVDYAFFLACPIKTLLPGNSVYFLIKAT